MKGNNLSDVKKANKQVVYECIRTGEQLTMTDIEHLTRLSRPTITALVQELVGDNLVVKSGYGISNGGRIPVLYSFNAGAAYAMGIDLEFPAVRMAVSDLECRVLSSSVRMYPQEADKEEVIRLLEAQIDDLLAESEIDRNRLLGVGVGIPGVIDYKNRFSVLIERIRGWENVPIGKILEEYVKKPVYLCNDVNLLSWAERKVTHMEQIPHMLYIAIRSGIGMAVWMDGNLLQGELGNSGRIGHMTVDRHGPECGCGGHGCLGLYVSERALRRMYKEKTGREVRYVGDLVLLADQEDSAAQEVLEISGSYLGIGIVNVANLFDISNIVVSASFDPSYLLKYAETALNLREKNTIRRKVDVRAGRLKEKDFGLGGCLLVLDKEHMSLLENSL